MRASVAGREVGVIGKMCPDDGEARCSIFREISRDRPPYRPVVVAK